MELYERTFVDDKGNRVSEWIPVPVPIPLSIVIRSALLNALAYTAGDQPKAAKLLGISSRVLSYQLAAHGIPGTGSGTYRKKHRNKRKLTLVKGRRQR